MLISPASMDGGPHKSDGPVMEIRWSFGAIFLVSKNLGISVVFFHDYMNPSVYKINFLELFDTYFFGTFGSFQRMDIRTN